MVIVVTKRNQELEQLSLMTRAELVELWQAAYGCLPPAGARRELLMYAAGWHIQAKRLGGFSRDMRRILRRETERICNDCRHGHIRLGGGKHNDANPLFISSDGRAGELLNRDDALPLPDLSAKRRKLVPGVRLLRDWNGTTHAVDVVESGYLYEGQTYKSLSAIARRITGAHWSGPRFFGL